ncbi:recombinase family protein [Sphaerimonospora cavernae]|uniref:Recombinase family protein n=1 Tax=Sphaerimonospora cavernae TaxID=1740611 RepID=A0ABV6U0R6_9ACTN
MSPNTAPKVVRILGVIRQSQTHDDTISPANQRAIQEAWVEARNLSSRDGIQYVIVGWAEDLGVSAGKTTPWERPELGKWLTDEKAEEWDMLLSWKLDRICRSALDFAMLVKWLDERGKTFACTNDPIDLDSPVGRAVAQIMAILAELELNTIKGRNLDNHRYMRQTGHWGGGRIGFGHMRKPGTKEIVKDPEMFEVLKEVIASLETQSLGSIATSLTEKGIPSSMDRQRQLRGEEMKGEAWSASTLSRVLRSRHLLGQREYKDAVIKGEDGMPTIFYQPLLDFSEWQRIQELLDVRSRGKGVPQKNTMLLRKVGECGVCGKPLHQQSSKRNGVPGPLRYRCASLTQKYGGSGQERCSNGTVKAETLDAAMENGLLEWHGNKPWRDKVFVPGEDHSEELKQVEDAIKMTRKEKDLGLYEGDEENYLSRITNLTNRRTALLAKPSRPSGYEYRPTSKTIAEHWASLTQEQKNAVLIKTGVRISYKFVNRTLSIDIDWGDLEHFERVIQGMTTD